MTQNAAAGASEYAERRRRGLVGGPAATGRVTGEAGNTGSDGSARKGGGGSAGGGLAYAFPPSDALVDMLRSSCGVAEEGADPSSPAACALLQAVAAARDEGEGRTTASDDLPPGVLAVGAEEDRAEDGGASSDPREETSAVMTAPPFSRFDFKDFASGFDLARSRRAALFVLRDIWVFFACILPQK